MATKKRDIVSDIAQLNIREQHFAQSLALSLNKQGAALGSLGPDAKLRASPGGRLDGDV